MDSLGFLGVRLISFRITTKKFVTTEVISLFKEATAAKVFDSQ